MTRTRIRAKAPLVVNTGGAQVGDSTNPAGSSLTVDGFSVAISGDEPAPAPDDAALFALSTSSAETNSSPVEDSLFFAIMQGVGDSAATPTNNRAFTISAGASTVTQTAGTGWQNPANAAGTSNAVSATINAPAALGGATLTGTLVGVFNDVVETLSETVTGTVSFAWFGSVTIGVLATGSVALSYSLDGGSNYTTLQTYTASAAAMGTYTIPLVLANLDLLRFRIVNTHTPSATGASGATLDAVVATIQLTGSGG